MTKCDRYRDLIHQAAMLSEEVVRTYVRSAAAGTPRYGKALLKYGAAVGRLVQEATFLGGGAWRRAADACKITHLGLAALYLQSSPGENGCSVHVIQDAARLSRRLSGIASTMEQLDARTRFGVVAGLRPSNRHRFEPQSQVDGGVSTSL